MAFAGFSRVVADLGSGFAAANAMITTQTAGGDAPIPVADEA
jgi:hypothetical protein